MAFSRIGALTFDTNENTAQDLLLDVANNLGYVLCYTSPGKIVKWDMSLFTRVGAINSSANNPTAGVIASTAGFLYVGDNTTDIIWKYNLTTFTEVASLDFGGTTAGVQSAIISPDETQSYWALSQNSAFGSLDKATLSNFSDSGSLGQSSPRKGTSLCIDNSQMIYGGFYDWSTTVAIKKINGSTMALVTTLPMASSEPLESCVIDSTYTYAYFVSNTSPIKVSKIRLSDLILIDVLTLSLNTSDTCVIDNTNQYLYVGTKNTPAEIIQIDLTGFTEVSSITLNSGENNIRGGKIDLTNNFVYFSTATSPAKVIKMGITGRSGASIPTNMIRGGFSVTDTAGNSYIYVAGHDGFLKRAENGTNFDGVSIAHEVHTGDMVISGSIFVESLIHILRLTGVAKNTTANDITITHYWDGKTTGTSYTISPDNTGYRIFNKYIDQNFENAVYHSYKLTISTNDETIGFEPLVLGLAWQPMRTL